MLLSNAENTIQIQTKTMKFLYNIQNSNANKTTSFTQVIQTYSLFSRSSYPQSPPISLCFIIIHPIYS
jgi:hypothetical protein